MKFRTFVPKSREVEAVQVTKENIQGIVDFLALHRTFKEDMYFVDHSLTGIVWYDDTMSRQPYAVIGDWLVIINDSIEIWSAYEMQNWQEV